MNFWKELQNKNKIFFTSAPLDGVSDFAFCRICLENGADVVFTEMKSASDLYFESKKLIKELEEYKEISKDNNVVLQIYGHEADKFGKAAKIAEKLGFSGIDINLGCPAKGVISSGNGVMNMRDLDNVYNIIKNTIENTSLPVSIKTRTGIKVSSIVKNGLKLDKKTEDFIENKEEVTILDLLRKIKDLPISCVTIHGRSFEQLFSGEIDYEIINKAKRTLREEFGLSPALIVNGGIKDKESLNKVIEKISPDGVMIATGSYGKPFVFNELKAGLDNKEFEVTKDDLKKIIYNHAKYLFNSKPTGAHLVFRKYLLWYLKDIDNFNKLRPKIVSIEDLDSVEEILKSF